MRTVQVATYVYIILTSLNALYSWYLKMLTVQVANNARHCKYKINGIANLTLCECVQCHGCQPDVGGAYMGGMWNKGLLLETYVLHSWYIHSNLSSLSWCLYILWNFCSWLFSSLLHVYTCAMCAASKFPSSITPCLRMHMDAPIRISDECGRGRKKLKNTRDRCC